MVLYLIRHGRQSSLLCNVDVGLSPEGRQQARLLGERLAGSGIETVYSSDMKRARETAKEANLIWNVPHVIRPALREISFGDMEGLTDGAIALKYADFKREQDRMDSDLAYPGGECAADVVKRGVPQLEEIAQSGVGCAAIVTHGVFIRCLTAYLLGVPLKSWRLLGTTMENCGITELAYYPKKRRFTLERFNDYAHLEGKPKLLRKAWVQTEN